MCGAADCAGQRGAVRIGGARLAAGVVTSVRDVRRAARNDAELSRQQLWQPSCWTCTEGCRLAYMQRVRIVRMHTAGIGIPRRKFAWCWYIKIAGTAMVEAAFVKSQEHRPPHYTQWASAAPLYPWPRKHKPTASLRQWQSSRGSGSPNCGLVFLRPRCGNIGHPAIPGELRPPPGRRQKRYLQRPA
jgi:hypothetical protein